MGDGIVDRYLTFVQPSSPSRIGDEMRSDKAEADISFLYLALFFK
jgi:hypothetical protein